MTKKIVERKDTVGKASVDAHYKPLDSRDPIEIQRVMQQDYIKELTQCVEAGKDAFTGDFFVVVITKRERLMQNVFRNYFFSRKSCPTPDYNQAVYFYNSRLESVEYVWCLPDPETCATLKQNMLIIHPEERQLLQHVLDFADGTLFQVAKRFNNEQSDSIFLNA